MSMSLITQDRTAKVMEVMTLVASTDITIAEACEKVGITYDTYHYWINRNKAGLEAFFEVMDMFEMQRTLEIETADLEIVRGLIADAKDKNQHPLTRLTIYQGLRKLANESTGRMRKQQEASANAIEFLSGPSLRPGKSRLTIEQDGQGATSIKIEPGHFDVIDGDEILDAGGEY